MADQEKLANTVIPSLFLLCMFETICSVITELVNSGIYFYQATDVIGHFSFQCLLKCLMLRTAFDLTVLS